MNMRLIKGIFLVTGTSIGGGMLALPVLTAQAGFMPSLVIYFLCWIFMCSTGLIFLEIALWMDKEANIISMATRTLGQFGKIAAWVLYLFLFFCLSLAYIVGCGDLVVQFFRGAVPEWLGSILFVLVFSPLIYSGAKVAGPINLILVVGLAVSYLAFVFLGFPHINPSLLSYQNWSMLPPALPIAFTAFAYQGIIPTLVNYMDRDIKDLRKVIVIGSFIPFIVYVIWQGLILGIIPVSRLMESLEKGENAVYPLRNFLDTPIVYVVGQFFAFFALVTSFIGVTLGLKDFLADGLKIKQNAKGRILICALIFLPPLAISYVYPGVFLVALDLAGGIGCALLLGMLPILMVWSGRYRLGLKGPYSFWGGKLVLGLLFCFVIFELLCQVR